MPDPSTNANYFKALNILFMALFTGQLLFAAVSFLLVASGTMDLNITALEKPFMVIIPVFYVITISAGYSMYKKRIEIIKQENELTAKLDGYRALYITRCALLEGANLFAIIAYLLTGSLLLIVLAALGMLFFLTLRPTKEKLEKELELSSGEIDNL